MNIIQSYFNYNIKKNDINFPLGYMSALSNWLSMAYSCLLLKKYNPDHRIIFYGNESLVYLFESLFKLPYDEYRIIECNGGYARWFYCWPKIMVYNEQTEPFIHVDSDVFIWRPMPDKLLRASLVAQHKERDSTFYMRVWKQIESDNVVLPEYVESCYDGKYVNACNAGIIGGNDIAFIKDYTKEIRKFLDDNKVRLHQSDKKYLYNVVFEQWLYYGLAKSKGKELTTFYDNVVTDFEMGEDEAPCQAASLKKPEYMHVMDSKGNIRCNRFIVYQMLADFPREYERILSVCRNYGIPSSMYTSYNASNIHESDAFKRCGKKSNKGQLPDICLAELDKFETVSANFLMSFQNRRDYIIVVQMRDKTLFKDDACNRKSAKDGKIVLSPYVKIVEANPSLIEALMWNFDNKTPENPVILLVYNAVFNKVDEFIWSKRKLQLLSALTSDGNTAMQLLLSNSKDRKIAEVSDFLRQCVFDGIITLESL